MKNCLLIFVLLAFAFTSNASEKRPPRKIVKKATRAALAFPVAGKRSALSDLWGASRSGGRRTHKGIDIDARRGTPVVAITDGIIVRREHTPIGGKTLWLRSSTHGVTAYYAHLDKQLVKSGQAVRKGQVIGTVGNTGNAASTPSHLHFGVQKNKKWVNPLPFVKNSVKMAAPPVTKKKAVKVKKLSYRSKRSKR